MIVLVHTIMGTILKTPRDSMKKIGYSIEIKLDGFCMRLHTVNLFITGFV